MILLLEGKTKLPEGLGELKSSHAPSLDIWSCQWQPVDVDQVKGTEEFLEDECKRWVPFLEPPVL